jgi:hypothetical protein
MESTELVMVATNAFGLGVDKANIRNVLHYHVPGSLEAYAQEAGRGGRDGKAARCVLLFSPDDVAIQEYFLSGTYPTKRQVRQVYEALEAFGAATGKLAEESPPNVANIALGSSVGQQRTRTVLSLLKDEGFITEKEGGLFYLADPPREKDELMERAKQYEARRIADRQRLDALLTYVKAPGCRNQVILEYLGEPEPPRCGRCDNCLRSREAALAASTEATRLGARLTRELDDDQVEQAKPRREIKARVVRIDQPQPEAAGGAAVAAAPAPAPAAPSTVLRRQKPGAATPPNGHAVVAAPAVETRKPAPVAVAPVVEAKKPVPAPPPPSHEDEEYDDEDEDDDDLDDDEIEVDENGNPIEIDDEDDDLDDDDEDDLDDEDDDDLDDDEDDDLDDDEDDDEYTIDKTAAELAQEGVEGPGEVTVLARKRLPKQPKQRPARPLDSPSASAAEARRRRRRRRRKRRAMLPPKAAFVTPVLSTAAPIPEAQPRRPGGGGGGPVIEYVRGPMRIAAAPVASANPNDAGVVRRRGKKRNRWERGPGGGGGGGFRGDRPRFDQRPGGPPGGAQPWQGQGGPNGNNGNGPPGEPGQRRRRRRRRRRGGNPLGMPAQMGGPMNGGGPQPPNGNEPVSFFQPTGGQQPPLLGPDGQPLRKRRRRRRRGRGGRNREWRAQNGGGSEGGGAPPSEGGGGPPPGSGGGGGGGSSMTSGDA